METLEDKLYHTMLWRQLKDILLNSIAWAGVPAAERMLLLTFVIEQWHSVPREREVAALEAKVLKLEKEIAWLKSK